MGHDAIEVYLKCTKVETTETAFVYHAQCGTETIVQIQQPRKNTDDEPLFKPGAKIYSIFVDGYDGHALVKPQALTLRQFAEKYHAKHRGFYQLCGRIAHAYRDILNSGLPQAWDTDMQTILQSLPISELKRYNNIGPIRLKMLTDLLQKENIKIPYK